jgi:hypothetical protein
MDRLRPEYEPLLVCFKNISEAPTTLEQRNFLHASKEKPFRKIIFLGFLI